MQEKEEGSTFKDFKNDPEFISEVERVCAEFMKEYHKNSTSFIIASVIKHMYEVLKTKIDHTKGEGFNNVLITSLLDSILAGMELDVSSVKIALLTLGISGNLESTEYFLTELVKVVKEKDLQKLDEMSNG